jgi:hypothetical protein
MLIAAAAVAGSLLAVPGALALDVDGDGWSDFRLREMPYLPYANVGSNCDVWQYNSPVHARLYVNSPVVWGLPGLGHQKVAWRARFYDTRNGSVRFKGPWKYRYVNERKSTRFGGGPNAGNGLMITHKQYWVGHQWYDHLADDGRRIRAMVDAAWLNSSTGKWIVRSLKVRWVISTSNRTIGLGQTGPSSTPAKDGTC